MHNTFVSQYLPWLPLNDVMVGHYKESFLLHMKFITQPLHNKNITILNHDDTVSSSVVIISWLIQNCYEPLLNQYEKAKETADNLKLENSILIIEKGLIESSWDLFIKKVEEIDSIEALEQLKNRFVHNL